MGSQLLGAQVPEHVPEPLLARHPVWDSIVEEPTYAVAVCSSSQLQVYMFLACVIKRAASVACSLPVWAPVGLVCRGLHTKGAWAWIRCCLMEEMYMDGAPAFWRGKLLLGWALGVWEEAVIQVWLSSSVNNGVEVSGSQARHLGRGLQREF